MTTQRRTTNPRYRHTRASLATVFAVLSALLLTGVLTSSALAQTPAASEAVVTSAPDAAAAQTDRISSATTSAAIASTAASPWGNPKARWLKGYPHQLKAAMRSPIRQVREDALVTLITLLQRPGYDQALKAPEAADALVPALLAVYADARRPAERQMAATAVCLIGKEKHGIETLIALSEKDRDRFVQRRARHAIASHYTRAYPELATWVAERQRKGKRLVISRARVERAQRRQARAQRRQARAERIAAEAAQGEEVVLGVGKEQGEQQ